MRQPLFGDLGGVCLTAIFFALPLTSELDTLYGSNVNPYSRAKHSSKFNSYVESTKTKRKKRHTRCLCGPDGGFAKANIPALCA